MQTSWKSKTIGPVEIVRRIGGGGMGEVYEGFHRRLEIPVTVKVIKPELTTDRGLVRRFLQEARLAASLRHPGIVRIYDVDLADGVPFYVMELLEGEPLDAILVRQGRLSQPRAVALALQMAEALAHAHQRGVIHRDVKPDNVVVDARWRAVLTDFGLALLHRARLRITEPGTPVGTPDYASPEQLSGRGGVDGRSDLYSLGVVLFELLTGELPFPEQDSLQKVVSRIDGKPRSMREVRAGIPVELDQLVLKLLAPVPANRFSSGEEVAVLLRRVQELPGMADPRDMEARVVSPAVPYAVLTGGQSEPNGGPPVRPHVILPRDEKTILIAGAPLARYDLISLLRSFAASTRHSSGYMLLTYADASDLVLYEGGRPMGCYRFDGAKFSTIRGSNVLQRARVQKDARVGCFIISRELMQVMRVSLSQEPLIKNLRGTFIRFDGLIEELLSMRLDGFIRLHTGQTFSFLVYRQGRLETAYLAGELLTSCQADPQREIASLLEHAAVPVVIDVFSLPRPDDAAPDASSAEGGKAHGAPAPAG